MSNETTPLISDDDFRALELGTLPSTREPSCPLCEDTGTVHFKGGDENCAACHARIVLDTDSPLPSTPDPVNPAELPSQTITVTTSGAATPPFPDRYLGTPTSDGAKGEAAGAGTADRGSLGAGIAELSATIAEQAAEIESLRMATHRKIRRVRARRLGQAEGTPPPTTTPGYQGSSQQQQFDIALQAQVIADQNKKIAEQSAEIERLIRVYSDQTDTIVKQAEKLTALDRERVALEAERDELRANLGLSLRHSGEMASKLDRLRGDVEELKIQRDAIEERFNAQTEKLVALDRERWDIEAERDELRTKIEMITEGRDCYRSAHDTLKDDFVAVEFQRDAAEARVTQLLLDIGSIESGRDRALYAEAEANARAEKYLAVIRAKDEQLVAVHRCWAAAIKATAAMSAAGIVIKAFVPSEQEETDHE